MINRVAASGRHSIRCTEVDRFYEPKEEVEKFLWADLVIIHFPITWFGLPGKFKTYLDTVLITGQNRLYLNENKEMDETYGSWGQLCGKKYVAVSIWDVPAASFNNPATFFEGKGPEELLDNVDKIFRYIGMQKHTSFAFVGGSNSSVIKHNMEDFRSMLEDSLLTGINEKYDG